MKWLRLYHEMLHDPKVQTLSADLFRGWINVLCIASGATDRGTLPDVPQVAFLMRIKESKAREILSQLTSRGLLDEQDDGSLKPHNWDERQPESDTSNARVQRYRDRVRANGEVVAKYSQHKEEVFSRDNFACVYCLNTKKLVLDHLIPVNRGGLGIPENLVTACKACNSGKSGRLIEEVGYVLRNPSAVTLYEAAKSRFGVAPVTVTEQPTVTVTGVNENGDCHGLVRARSEEIRGEEIRREQPPLPPEGGAAAAPIAPLPPGAEAAIAEAHDRFGDNAAALVKAKARTIDAQLGGRFDVFLDSLEAASHHEPPLKHVFAWCMTRSKAKINEPARPASAYNARPADRSTPPPLPGVAESKGCERCEGTGLASVYHPDPKASRQPASTGADCTCPLGRSMRATRKGDDLRRVPDLADVLAGKSAWRLERPEESP